MGFDEFEKLVRTRRATRNFKPDAIPEDLLRRLVDLARWAPNAYNLQPTHLVVVDDPSVKPALQKACLGQRQVLEAPVVVVFAGDRRVDQNNLEKMIAEEISLGAIDQKYATALRRNVERAFGQGPYGLGWLAKAGMGPLLGFLKPTPSIPAVHKRYWVAKQVMLTAMTFMLAASASGLATSPMEGFDEKRVKHVLRIPKHFIVPVVVCVGYARGEPSKKSRLPLENVFHRNKWE